MSELRNPPGSDDFEWVNAWAHAAAPATGDKPNEPAQTPTSDSDLTERPAPQEMIAVAPVRIVADAPSQEPSPQQPADVVAPEPPVTAPSNIADAVTRAPRKPGPDADQLVRPAPRRFFSALRGSIATRRDQTPMVDVSVPDPGPQLILAVAPALPVATCPQLPSEPAPADTGLGETAPVAMPVAIAAKEPAKVESTQAGLAPDDSLLERDIADIECTRDALLESEPSAITEPKKVRGRFSALRHAESVPILIGSVVGATLLLVFGAAASLISLR